MAGKHFWGRMLLLGGAVLLLWTGEAEKKAHYYPGYAQEDLREYLEKDVLEPEDYREIYRQTGLGRAGVEQLWQENSREKLLFLQERFFAPVEYRCSRSHFLCHSERLTGASREETAGDFAPAVQTGDVLVTFSGHIFGWRSGHAALVVDGEQGLTLEAMAPGKSSGIRTLESWRGYPGFVLLRWKNLSGEQAEEMVAYARENLTDIPYDLFSMTAVGEADEISGTQCAHLVWAAFHHLGLELNSGRLFVTPGDIFRNENLEIVQIYGLEPG